MFYEFDFCIWLYNFLLHNIFRKMPAAKKRRHIRPSKSVEYSGAGGNVAGETSGDIDDEYTVVVNIERLPDDYEDGEDLGVTEGW